ncbi:TetR/AcrR family transcriptional regulator [Micromonospora peucetia]|uniref:TetR family transcriptional regulator n=1 Tax=Micromonospora peucetia TaxID=47871 RepID=A0A1C6U660_9ACTN|nr:TetR family transcriptional regulator [Micromonospora peucetia]WSA33481.1 TetR family transcriptional regulator [Micromonospora peucetia]SCL49401.1 transcriptional regulator, TetR family [Micromonospora peucetia]
MGEVRDGTRTRDSIVEAARTLTVATGWDSVRMGAVASAAGVSRQTVYNEFGSKAGLAEALARREIDRFVGDVRALLRTHGDDVRAAAHATITHTLTEAADDPLIKAVLTSDQGGSDELLPYLTTRQELVLTEATEALLEWADTVLPGADRAAVTFATDSVVRLVISHIILPNAPVEQTAAALADLAVYLLLHAVTLRSYAD